MYHVGVEGHLRRHIVAPVVRLMVVALSFAVANTVPLAISSGTVMPLESSDTSVRHICAPCVVSTQTTSPTTVPEQAAASSGDRDTLVEKLLTEKGVACTDQARSPVARTRAWKYDAVVAKARPSVDDVTMANLTVSPPIMARLHSYTPSVVRSAHTDAASAGQAVSSMAPKLSSAGATLRAEAPSTPAVHSTVGASVTASKEMARSVALV